MLKLQLHYLKPEAFNTNISNKPCQCRNTNYWV